MPLDTARRNQIKQVFEQFLRNRARTIRRLKIEDLNINPFLIRILAKEMGLDDANSIIRWLVMQRSMTGANTSFGFCLQDIAKLFSEGTGVEGADIQKTKSGRRHHIQVKSGPSTMDKAAVEHMSQLLLSVLRRNRGSVALLGMCYGTPEQVMSTVKKYSSVDWLIGRQFWEFISDDPDCIDEIYEIAATVGEEFRDAQGQTLSEILDAKIEELQRQFEKLYSKSGSIMWKNLLNENS
ncbi:MAG: PmeII family type II restriction endonuclease [Anaerolineae bacterium]